MRSGPGQALWPPLVLRLQPGPDTALLGMDNVGDLTLKEDFFFLGFPTHIWVLLSWRFLQHEMHCLSFWTSSSTSCSFPAREVLFTRRRPQPATLRTIPGHTRSLLLRSLEGAHVGSQVSLLFQLNAEERNSNLPMAHKDSRDSHGVDFLIALGQEKMSYWDRKEVTGDAKSPGIRCARTSGSRAVPAVT